MRKKQNGKKVKDVLGTNGKMPVCIVSYIILNINVKCPECGIYIITVM